MSTFLYSLLRLPESNQLHLPCNDSFSTIELSRTTVMTDRLELSTGTVSGYCSQPIELSHPLSLLIWPDSNQQPFAYKATALTIELQTSEEQMNKEYRILKYVILHYFILPIHASAIKCWLRKIRTFISSFVVKYSHPLNYKPINHSFSFIHSYLLLYSSA